MILVNRHYDMMYENLDHQYSADMILLRYIKYIKHKPLHILMINWSILQYLSSWGAEHSGRSPRNAKQFRQPLCQFHEWMKPWH